jgi:molybdate transport system substrate-binding protein
MRMNCCKTFAAASTLLLSVGIAGAAEVTLISVGGVKGALDKIVADYTKETGNHVMYTVGSPLIVSKKLADGEAFDVVVQSDPAMDDYAKLGGVKTDTRIKVARGGIGMAMRKDATPLDISTPDAFKKALLEAKSIAMTDTAMPNGSGILTQRILHARQEEMVNLASIVPTCLNQLRLLSVRANSRFSISVRTLPPSPLTRLL